jgi:hypothetical protein
MSIHMGSFFDELEKIAVGGLPAGLSMTGLGGLTAIEGAGAFDKHKSKGERVKDGASAAFTGSILAGEMIHNKDMLKGIGKRLLTKKAATVSNAAMMKNHMLVDSQRAAGKPQTQAAPALMKKDPSHYSDFMPSTSVGHQPVQRAAPAVRSSVALPSAGPVRSAARPQAMGVMARIANTFKKA